jgi:hypothetical protein
MATKKRKKTTKKTAGPGVSQRIGKLWQSEHMGWAKKKLGILILLVLLAAVIGFGFSFLERYVQEVNRSRQVNLKVKLEVNGAPPPRWASEELIRQVCLSTEIRQEDDFSDPELVKRWNENLAKNPWVKKIHRLHKRYEGEEDGKHEGMLIIDCELRQPLASVQADSGLCYVDAEGMVLPAVPLDGPGGHLVRLQGGANKSIRSGIQISSESLLAGIQVLSEIRKTEDQLPTEDQLWSELAVMDVSNYEGRLDPRGSHLVIYTGDNTEIRWGAALKRERPYYEAPAVTKLMHLYRSHRRYKSFKDYEYVDLRYLRKEKADPLRRPKG